MQRFVLDLTCEPNLHQCPLTRTKAGSVRNPPLETSEHTPSNQRYFGGSASRCNHLLPTVVPVLVSSYHLITPGTASCSITASAAASHPAPPQWMPARGTPAETPETTMLPAHRCPAPVQGDGDALAGHNTDGVEGARLSRCPCVNVSRFN